jgi:hypothetical protein
MDQYLTHYWPISNGQTLDVLDGYDIIQGVNTTLTLDRFGCSNSALALNDDWTQVPSGNYFHSPEFTISVWIYPQQISSESRIIDFGSGQSDNVVISLATNMKPYFWIYEDISFMKSIQSLQALTLGQWQMLTATFDGNKMSLYLNETLTISDSFVYTMPSRIRSNCFIGKSNFPCCSYSKSLLDDLRFYNISLNQNDIKNLMENSSRWEKKEI